jgi:hypothetical protein
MGRVDSDKVIGWGFDSETSIVHGLGTHVLDHEVGVFSLRHICMAIKKELYNKLVIIIKIINSTLLLGSLSLFSESGFKV